MENDGKYYTPTIEEFHVGFEYEVKKEESWFRCFYSQGSLVDIYYKYNDDLDSIDFEADTIRVKYLDQEDIESLGFKHEVSDNAGGYWFKGNYTLNYYFKHSSLPNSLIITSDDYGNTIVLFNGIIKNKSELIKVLKQVNINE
jgi:hypothetical protein